LKNRIESGEVPGLRIVREKRFLFLYEVDEKGEIKKAGDPEGRTLPCKLKTDLPVQVDLFGAAGCKT
jgi:hypothetical protein